MVYGVFVVCIIYNSSYASKLYCENCKQRKKYKEKGGKKMKKYFLRRVLSQAENCRKEIKGWLITCPEEIRNFDVYFKLSSCVCWQFIVRKFSFFVFYFPKNWRECYVDPQFWNGCQAMEEQLFCYNLPAGHFHFKLPPRVESRMWWWWGGFLVVLMVMRVV